MAVVTVAKGIADNLAYVLLQLAAIPIVVITAVPIAVITMAPADQLGTQNHPA